MRLLDLFCGAGGAAVGYARAGFEVTGVDIKPQPNYPFSFKQADALYMLQTGWVDMFDAIHASPPCQAFTQMSARWRGKGTKADEHLDLLTPTLKLVAATGLPYVVENVPGARSLMPEAITLHGGMFGLGVHRPRLFTTNFLLMLPTSAQTKDPVRVYGKADGRRVWGETRAWHSLEQGSEAMGIDWMNVDELREAIPPAYTEFIGHQLMAHIANSPGQ